jgi:alkylated DNA nucleotide flippase Atl1
MVGEGGLCGAYAGTARATRSVGTIRAGVVDDERVSVCRLIEMARTLSDVSDKSDMSD